VGLSFSMNSDCGRHLPFLLFMVFPALLLDVSITYRQLLSAHYVKIIGGYFMCLRSYRYLPRCFPSRSSRIPSSVSYVLELVFSGLHFGNVCCVSLFALKCLY
jgi:hypothetical protein